jgi:hypothetical protein
MVEPLLDLMQGSVGRGLVEFILAHPVLINTILGIWLVVFTAGRLQMRRIKYNTVRMVVNKGGAIVAQKPHITPSGLYKRIYPIWSETVSDWAWFVPHSFGFWPEPVTPERVAQLLPFTPEWVTEVLIEHGVPVEEFASATTAPGQARHQELSE